MKSCENCSNLHDGQYGSGRFCSSKCARGFSSIEKRQIINEKISKKLSGKISPHKGKRLIDRKIIYCKVCNTQMEIPITSTKLFCSKSCASKNRQLQLSKEGRHNGFPSRKEKNPSWAEQFVIDFLNKRNITFSRDYKVNRFFADFAFTNKMIILEIDGKQHTDRKEYDKNRDLIISKEGWKIVRIPWKHKDFEYMQSQIENFIISNL